MATFTLPPDFKAFPIGTEYTSRDKRKARCVVVDYIITFSVNHPDIFKFTYVVRRAFAGQIIMDSDVVHTTIAMALAEEGRDHLGESVVIGVTKTALAA